MADGITRGTTPSITVTVPMDLTGYTCFLSIGRKPKTPYLTASNDQMTATYGETSTSSLPSRRSRPSRARLERRSCSCESSTGTRRWHPPWPRSRFSTW